MAFGYGITNGNSLKNKGAQKTYNSQAAAGTIRDYTLDSSDAKIGAQPKDQVSLSKEASADDTSSSGLNLDWAKDLSNGLAKGAGKLVSDGEAMIRHQSLTERIRARKH